MRVNWFSPLPPVSLPAADYTRRLLPVWRSRAEIILWTDQRDCDAALAEWATVRPLGLDPGAVPWEEINRADATVYHLGAGAGNNAFRVALCCRHPGIVVLHGEVGAEALDVALAVVVQERALFERLRREDRWPVVYAPLTPEGHAEVLLRLAAEAATLSGANLARDLVRQAGAEIGVWMSAASASFWLGQVAAEVHQVSIGP
jgi:hypothetical protein